MGVKNDLGGGEVFLIDVAAAGEHDQAAGLEPGVVNVDGLNGRSSHADNVRCTDSILQAGGSSSLQIVLGSHFVSKCLCLFDEQVADDDFLQILGFNGNILLFQIHLSY